MPLTRRSEGTKIHLLKAAALRVGFLSAEFRRLNIPPNIPATPSDPIGAFIATITRPVFSGTVILDLKPIGGVFPKGTSIILKLATNITGFETLTAGIVLSQQATGEEAVHLLAQEQVLPSFDLDQGLGPAPTGVAITDLGAGLIRYEMVNVLNDDFLVEQCEIVITGGGTTVIYTGTP